jgi:hypothetical protein
MTRDLTVPQSMAAIIQHNTPLAQKASHHTPSTLQTLTTRTTPAEVQQNAQDQHRESDILVGSKTHTAAINHSQHLATPHAIQKFTLQRRLYIVNSQAVKRNLPEQTI